MALSAPLNFPSLSPFTSTSCTLELSRICLSCDKYSAELRDNFKISVDFANLLLCLRSSKEAGMLVAGVTGAELLLRDSARQAKYGFKWFRSEKGFNVSILVWNRVCFSLWSDTGYFVNKELLLFRINVGRFVAPFKCSRKWKPFLISCGHI